MSIDVLEWAPNLKIFISHVNAQQKALIVEAALIIWCAGCPPYSSQMIYHGLMNKVNNGTGKETKHRLKSADFYWLRLSWFLPWLYANFPSGKINQFDWLIKLQYGSLLRADQPASRCIEEGDGIYPQWTKYSIIELLPLLVVTLLTPSIPTPSEGLIHHHSILTAGKEFISQHKVEGLGWCPMWHLGLGSGMNPHSFRINWTCRMVGRPTGEFAKNNVKQASWALQNFSHFWDSGVPSTVEAGIESQGWKQGSYLKVCKRSS